MMMTIVISASVKTSGLFFCLSSERLSQFGRGMKCYQNQREVQLALTKAPKTTSTWTTEKLHKHDDDYNQQECSISEVRPTLKTLPPPRMGRNKAENITLFCYHCNIFQEEA